LAATLACRSRASAVALSRGLCTALTLLNDLLLKPEYTYSQSINVASGSSISYHTATQSVLLACHTSQTCPFVLHLQARFSPCLLPQGAAAVMPSLSTLVSKYHNTESCGVAEVAKCGSLRSLTCSVSDGSLLLFATNPNHTPANLRRQLHNIRSLQIETTCYPSAEETSPSNTPNILLQAWPHQLEDLELRMTFVPESLLQCLQLRSFTWSGKLRDELVQLVQLPLLSNVTLLCCMVPESALHWMTQSPSLRRLRFPLFDNNNLAMDWSAANCVWEHVCIHQLAVSNVARLPLQALKLQQGSLDINVSLSCSKQ
jgi:hypothetical protein